VNIFKTLTKPSSNRIAALEQIKRLETHSHHQNGGSNNNNIDSGNIRQLKQELEDNCTCSFGFCC